MITAVMIAIDLVAIVILTFGLYFPRHRRRDLVVAYLTVNVGVLAVSVVLADAVVGAGLGLGLFGVLSIIRLRSSEISQRAWPTTSRRSRRVCSAGSRHPSAR